MQTIDFLDQLFVLTERIIIITHFTSSQYWLIPEKHSSQYYNVMQTSSLKEKNIFSVRWVIIKISPHDGEGKGVRDVANSQYDIISGYNPLTKSTL